MDTARRRAPAWQRTVFIAVVTWLVGCYLPAISNLWALANVVVPANQERLITLPGAYPAVGIDASSLCSLLGLLIVLGSAVRYATYWQMDAAPTPPPPGLSPAP